MKPEGMSGLEQIVFLAKGAKVMLTMNLWPHVGLCNGATGTAHDFIYEIGFSATRLTYCCNCSI